MTLEDVHQLLVGIVKDRRSTGPYPGVLGSALGADLARLGAKDIHKQFAFEKLADFLRAKCQPPLVLRSAPNSSDVLVNLAPSQGSDSLDGGGPRTTNRVDPRVWNAVLTPHSIPVLLSPDGRVVTGDVPEDSAANLKRVSRMSVSAQAQVLEDTRPIIKNSIRHTEVQSVVLAALERSKVSDIPIIEFSHLMTGLYRAASGWNNRRIDAVFSLIENDTGVDLRRTHPGHPPPGSSSTPIAPEAPKEALPATVTENMPAVGGSELDALRADVKTAIDSMSLSELLELRLPVNAFRTVLNKARS